MLVGTVREVKNRQHRIGLMPETGERTRSGQRVSVESRAGDNIDAIDEAYIAVDAVLGR